MTLAAPGVGAAKRIMVVVIARLQRLGMRPGFLLAVMLMSWFSYRYIVDFAGSIGGSHDFTRNKNRFTRLATY